MHLKSFQKNILDALNVCDIIVNCEAQAKGQARLGLGRSLNSL